jgi:hypothetical protein
MEPKNVILLAFEYETLFCCHTVSEVVLKRLFTSMLQTHYLKVCT